MPENKIVIAITGASGAIYGKVLLDKLSVLREQVQEVGVVMSDNAKQVWEYELGHTEYTSYPFTFYSKNDFFAPFASGSADFNTMIVAPCSMGTMGRIATGVSNDLIARAADVILKERRKLILVIRDTPYSLIHINNMKTVTEAGAIVCPASPSFYSRPENFEQLAATVIDRVIHLADLEHSSYQWGGDDQ